MRIGAVAGFERGSIRSDVFRAYEPTKCSHCGVTIKLGTDGYTRSDDEHWCESCTSKEMNKKMR
jgi:hypothetical protein